MEHHTHLAISTEPGLTFMSLALREKLLVKAPSMLNTTASVYGGITNWLQLDIVWSPLETQRETIMEQQRFENQWRTWQEIWWDRCQVEGSVLQQECSWFYHACLLWQCLPTAILFELLPEKMRSVCRHQPETDRQIKEEGKVIKVNRIMKLWWQKYMKTVKDNNCVGWLIECLQFNTH